MAKSKYDQKVVPNLGLIEKMVRNGGTNEDIRKKLGIGKTTWYKYVNQHEELSELLNKNREIVDADVENALLKKALGFKTTVKKHFKVKEVKYENGKKVSEKEELKAVEDEIYIPPDLGAQCFWLKNRLPEEWRDKVKVEDNNAEETEVIMLAAVEEDANEQEDNMETTA